jgi:peptide/nickel transport system permease protein|tara:strand:+ start:2207 stop:3094 length:888 start_codon:yes stop_codon:yes gene_type:complete
MTDRGIIPASGYGAALLRALKSFGLLRESRVGMIGAGLVLFWIIVAIFAPLIAPYHPTEQIEYDLLPGTTGPNGNFFLLGTDQRGLDILSRIIWGSRTVLIWAPLATLTAYVVGIVMGLAAGYLRGWVDDVLSRISDIILSFPVLVLYILIITTFGASKINIVIAITFASSPGIMRIVRGLVLDLRNRDYVAAAQTRGESAWHIMLVEILPNARGPLIVDACLRLGYVIITIGVLGFLGLGIPPPDPDWGGMINQSRQVAMEFPHMTLFPCIAISSLILGFNLLADGLREISLRD